MAERLRFGVLGAGFVAGRALIPAMNASRRACCVAIASRDARRAAAMAAEHGIATVHSSYEALLEDDSVDAVYIALHNSAHLPWTLRALQAGKHVLCEKPLGINAEQVRTMMASAASCRRSLMEAFMYRFHPRMQTLHEAVSTPVFAAATFGFTLGDPANYRWDATLGGGALLDVGCYTLDVLRWLLGEPDSVHAVMHESGVDISVACVLAFSGGAIASAWASIEAPEQQELLVVENASCTRVERPFTSWRDPDDPYQLMTDAFAAHVIDGSPSPRALEESLATATLMDRVRAAASSRT